MICHILLLLLIFFPLISSLLEYFFHLFLFIFIFLFLLSGDGSWLPVLSDNWSSLIIYRTIKHLKQKPLLQPDPI